MATKRFLTSVADVFGYDENDNLLFTSKTLIDSSIEVTLGSTEVRGGRGNQLLYVYYHSNAMNVTLNDTQWNLQMLGATVGESIATGADIYTEETITLGASGGGTVTGTPLAIQGSTIYGWVTQLDGAIQRVTFSGSTFATSSGTSGDVVCVRYLAADAAARSITIPANAIPKVVRLVMEASLNSGDDSANKIGKVQFIVYKATLSGSFTLSLTSDGVSQTPLTAMALAYQDTETASCTSAPVYCKIIEVLDDATWYENVIALAIEGGDFALTHPATRTLVVYAIKNNGDAPFLVENSELTFTSGTTGTATIGTNTGLVTTVASGTTLLKAVITSKTSVEASCTLTVS